MTKNTILISGIALLSIYSNFSHYFTTKHLDLSSILITVITLLYIIELVIRYIKNKIVHHEYDPHDPYDPN